MSIFLQKLTRELRVIKKGFLWFDNNFNCLQLSRQTSMAHALLIKVLKIFTKK